MPIEIPGLPKYKELAQILGKVKVDPPQIEEFAPEVEEPPWDGALVKGEKLPIGKRAGEVWGAEVKFEHRGEEAYVYVMAGLYHGARRRWYWTDPSDEIHLEYSDDWKEYGPVVCRGLFPFTPTDLAVGRRIDVRVAIVTNPADPEGSMVAHRDFTEPFFQKARPMEFRNIKARFF